MRIFAAQPKLAPSRPSAAQIGTSQFASVASTVVTLALVLAAGAAISAALPQKASFWLVASAYLAPASMAFAIRWWIAQRH